MRHIECPLRANSGHCRPHWITSSARASSGGGTVMSLGSLQVQEHLNLCGLLNRHLARLFAFENSANINAGQTVSVGNAAAITQQAAGGDELAVFEDCRYRMADGQRGELFAPANE